MYDFIWEPKIIMEEEKTAEIKLAQACEIPIVQADDLKTESFNFNLPRFLEITKGHIPTNEEYKQLIVFFGSQGLDPTETQTLCNAAWGYTSSETHKFRSLRMEIIYFISINQVEVNTFLH